MTDYIRKVEHATSVKEIGIIKEPTRKEFGVADFTFRPVFSVFDYGTIQPAVPLDNSTICLMQGFNFETLRQEGVDSHYIGLVTEEGDLISAKQAVMQKIAPWTTRVKMAHRVMPEFKEGKWDYSMFGGDRARNYVQPIEFISRNELPEASSVWKRVAKGQTTMEDLGLPADFKPGDDIPSELKPILDYSTKFEPDDRYLTPAQAQQLMGIGDAEFAAINASTTQASNLMTAYAASRGFERLDGKVEYVGGILGDAVCTWHEDRLKSHGLGISKQRIRDKVKALNGEWYDNIQECKERAKEEGVEDFRTLMDPSIKYVSPDAEFFNAVNTLFRAATNQWVGAKVYTPHPGKDDSLEDSLVRAIHDFKKVT